MLTELYRLVLFRRSTLLRLYYPFSLSFRAYNATQERRFSTCVVPYLPNGSKQTVLSKQFRAHVYAMTNKPSHLLVTELQ